MYNANPVINLKRPLLGYPAVLFTNKYEENDAIARLQAIADADAIVLSTTWPEFSLITPKDFMSDLNKKIIVIDASGYLAQNMQSSLFIKYYSVGY